MIVGEEAGTTGAKMWQEIAVASAIPLAFDFDSLLGECWYIQTLLPLSMDWPKFRQAKSGFSRSSLVQGEYGFAFFEVNFKLTYVPKSKRELFGEPSRLRKLCHIYPTI